MSFLFIQVQTTCEEWERGLQERAAAEQRSASGYTYSEEEDQRAMAPDPDDTDLDESLSSSIAEPGRYNIN